MKEIMYLNHKGHKEKLFILKNFVDFVNFVVKLNQHKGTYYFLFKPQRAQRDD